MTGNIDPDDLIGTWQQVRPTTAIVLILRADGKVEFEFSSLDLAGAPIRARAVGGEWSLAGDRLRVTLRAESATTSGEGTVEYRVLGRPSDELALQELVEEGGKLLEFERW